MLSLILFAALTQPGPPERLVTPADAFHSALADLELNVKPDRRHATRYLSLHAIPPADRPAFVKALIFALNSTSFRTNFALPVLVGSSLARIDLDSLGWDRANRERTVANLAKDGVKLKFKDDAERERFLDIWEDIGRFDPYFRANRVYGDRLVSGWIDPKDDLSARNLSGSDKFIVRADWLLTRILLEAQQGGFYSQLLILPPSEADLYKRVGTPIEFVDREGQTRRGGAVVESVVALHNRELQEIPSSLGYDLKYVWRTFDFLKDDDDARNVFRSLGGTARHDGREVIGSLPNGLNWYYLADGKGKQVAFVPQDIAIDKRPTKGKSYDKTITNAIRCFSCHGPQSGIYPFDDRVRAAILADDIALAVLSKSKDAAAIKRDDLEEYYLSRLGDKIAKQQESYAERVGELTGLEPGANSDALVGFFDRYFWEPVTEEQAYRELGYPPDHARKLMRYGSGNSDLVVLSSGQPIRRAIWERAFPDAATAVLPPPAILNTPQGYRP